MLLAAGYFCTDSALVVENKPIVDAESVKIEPNQTGDCCGLFQLAIGESKNI